MKANLGVWTDEAGDADEAAVSEELSDLCHSTDVLLSIARGEPQVSIHTHTDVVAVECVRRDALTHEQVLQREAHRRLARARQTCSQGSSIYIHVL